MEEKKGCNCADGLVFYDKDGVAIFPHKIICTKCSPFSIKQ